MRVQEGRGIKQLHCVPALLSANLASEQVELMDKHLENGKVQAHAFSTLAMIALNNKENRTRMEENEVFKRIFLAMKRHLMDRKVQGMACYALMSVLNASTRAEIEAQGAVSHILEAARFHPDCYVQASPIFLDHTATGAVHVIMWKPVIC